MRPFQLAVTLAVALILAACGPEAPASQAPPGAATGAPAAVLPTRPPLPTAIPAAGNVLPPTAGVPTVNEENAVTTPSGLRYIEVAAGTGPAPQTGEIVAVHYRGQLENGTVFDSSYESGEPIRFALGRGMVIAGWDEGIALMRQGGKARLVIPPDLAYGTQGAGGGIIPPNATLIFDVELVDIQAGAPAAPQPVAESDYVTTASGLKYYDFVVGTGDTARAGATVTVHYTGWLADGTPFDSSLNRGQPFSFPLGAAQVIPGWDEGVAGMQVGGRRQLVIPPELGYGAQGAGGIIPPNATLIFEVELVSIN